MYGKLKAKTPDPAEAARLITERGWCHGSHDPEKLCLLQALAVTMTGDTRDWTEPVVLNAAAALVVPVIRREFPGRDRSVIPLPDVDIPWIFNEHPRTRQRDVLRVLAEAAG